MKSPWAFKQYGQSGIPVSDLFPNVATCVDDLCVIRSMVGDGVDHGAALLQLHTGVFSFRRPSMGSWALYGLGTENQNLPGFITIKPTLGHGGQNNWSSSFLPGEYQGTPIGNSDMKIDGDREGADAVPDPERTDGREPTLRAGHAAEDEPACTRRNNDHDPDLEARIGALELAFRMQIKAPEAFDVATESDATEEAVWPGQRKHARFRLAVPAGAPAFGTRRALCAVLAQLQMGPAHRSFQAAYQERGRSGQADRGSVERFEERGGC